MKKTFVKFVCSIALIFAGLAISVYLYVESDYFRETVGNKLSKVIGESVELGDELEINSFFPLISITVPNARLRTSGETGGLNRARLQHLQIAISHGVLFSSGTEGKVKITTDDVTIITQTGASAPPPESHSSIDGEADQVSIADQLHSVKQTLSGLDIELSIKEFNYYARSKTKGNNAYHLSDVSVDSLYGNTMKASAKIHEGERVVQNLTIEIEMSETTTELIQDSSGLYSVHIAAADEQYPSHHLQGEWQLQGNDLNLQSLEYKSDEVWLRGDVKVSQSLNSIAVKSDLELRQWNYSTNNAAPDASSDTSPPARLFSYELFTTSIPRNLSANIALYLGAIRVDGLPIINGQLQLSLAEGVFSVSGEKLTVLGGNADLYLQVDNTLEKFYGLDLKFEADDVQLDRIKSSTDNDTILSRGEVDMIMALRGAGPSPGHIASTLDGYLIATVNAAQIKQKYTTLIDVGVVSWAIERLSLLTKEDEAQRRSANLSDPLTIDCASLRLYINDGRIEVSNGAIIELPDNVLFSSGYIDLRDETLGFAFRTQRRSIFDWSAISIAKYAEISGSLSKPAITLNPRELAKQGVMSASSMAWGPLPSLVYSLAESGLKNHQDAECTTQID